MTGLVKNEKITSIEIAEIAGKKHKDVMRAIRNMEPAWEKVNGRKFALSSYLTNQNREMPMYELSKPESLYIGTKFNDVARAKLIKRWQELENNPAANITKIDLAKMVIETEEENIRLNKINELQAAELEKQAPKALYYDEVLQSNSTYLTNQIAKEIGYSAVSLNKLLNQLGIQYKQNDTWLLYAKHQNKGYTRTKTWTYTNSEGSVKTSMQTVWTEKGRVFIHDQVNKFVTSKAQ